MDLLLLICGSAEEAGTAMAGCCAEWSEEATREGVLVAGIGLAAPGNARSIRVRDGNTLLSDGPFAETKDQVGGLCILRCRDWDHAVEVASKHPAAKFGVLELRPLASGEHLPPSLMGSLLMGTGDIQLT